MEKENFKDAGHTDPMHDEDPLIHPYGQSMVESVSFDPLAGGKPEDAVMSKKISKRKNKF